LQRLKSKSLDHVVFDPKFSLADFQKFIAKKKCNVYIFEAQEGTLYNYAMEKQYQ
jgi:hypothetical protein